MWTATCYWDGNRILAASYQGNLMAFDAISGRIVWGMEAFQLSWYGSGVRQYLLLQ